MNIEIKPIKQLGNIQGLNAKELYEFLELDKSNYTRWIKEQIENNKFCELNYDYITLRHKRRSGNNPNATVKETYIKMDFAKQLAMTSNSQKGVEVRRYFIECEKKLRQSITKTIEPHEKPTLNHTKDEKLKLLHSELLIDADRHIKHLQKQLDLWIAKRDTIVKTEQIIEELRNYDE